MRDHAVVSKKDVPSRKICLVTVLCKRITISQSAPEQLFPLITN